MYNINFPLILMGIGNRKNKECNRRTTNTPKRTQTNVWCHQRYSFDKILPSAVCRGVKSVGHHKLLLTTTRTTRTKTTTTTTTTQTPTPTYNHAVAFTINIGLLVFDNGVYAIHDVSLEPSSALFHDRGRPRRPPRRGRQKHWSDGCTDGSHSKTYRRSIEETFRQRTRYGMRCHLVGEQKPQGTFLLSLFDWWMTDVDANSLSSREFKKSLFNNDQQLTDTLFCLFLNHSMYASLLLLRHL